MFNTVVRNICAGFVLLALLQLPQTAAASQKPNFVYIIADDQDYATANEHIMPHLASGLPLLERTTRIL